jgi:hypothetical protein
MIFLLSLFAGCIYVDPFVQVGENNASAGQAAANEVCKINCDNHVKYLPLGCVCPETPTPVPAGVTPAPSGV